MKYIIYKIQINDYIYIGSTKSFANRKSNHKRDCNNGKDVLVYRTIREHGGWDCCSMVPIREIDVETKTQAHIAEEAVRVEYNAQMNTYRAYQTEDERKEYCRVRMQTDERKEAARLYNQTDARKEAARLYNQTDAYKEYQRQYHQSDAGKEKRRKYDLAKKTKKDLEEKPLPSIV
jgi:hypothetical protein